MTEFRYGLKQKTSKAPVIKKLGALKRGMEQTPVMFKGKQIIVESVLPDSEYNYQHIVVRNLETNEIYTRIGKDFYFVSAFCENDVLYAFATSKRDNKELTMYDPDTDPSQWHDPRGGHIVRMFKTVDLINWEEKDVIVCNDRRLWNTSVCKGDGKYVMAIEVSHDEEHDVPQIGHAFTTFFAESYDMENWTMLSDDYCYTPERYNACPAIRYSNGYYYMICLETLPCERYASYIYRTKDLLHWEVGFHNPIMMWSDEDRVPKEGVIFSEEDLELLQTGLNINCSDIDLFEVDSKTHIYYANGDQMSYSFLCEAVCDLPLDEFLEAFFK